MNPTATNATQPREMAATNLIRDGSFEKPKVPKGSYNTYNTGTTFGPWKVVGAAGDVAIVSTSYVTNGYGWTAGCGKQSLDLADGGGKTGVSQTISTSSGKRTLSFKVGNFYDPGTFLGKTSTVDVLVDGKRIFRATNSKGKGVMHQVWESFHTDFTPKSAKTTIEFLNGDPKGDLANGLDCVVAK